MPLKNWCPSVNHSQSPTYLQSTKHTFLYTFRLMNFWYKYLELQIRTLNSTAHTN